MAGRYLEPRIERASRATLAALQLERLRAQLAHAAAHSPFYRRKLKAAGARPKLRSLDDVRALPFTTKDELKANQADHPPWGDLLAVPVDDVVRIHMTSATTGRPLAFLDTADDWHGFFHSYARSLYGRGDRLPEELAGPAPGEEPVLPETERRVSLKDLLRAFAAALATRREEPVHHVEPVRVTLEEKIHEIRRRLTERGQVRFGELFAPDAPRLELVVTLIALLEMVRNREARLVQTASFGEIEIRPGPRAAHEGAVAEPGDESVAEGGTSWNQA